MTYQEIIFFFMFFIVLSLLIDISEKKWCFQKNGCEHEQEKLKFEKFNKSWKSYSKFLKNV